MLNKILIWIDEVYNICNPVKCISYLEYNKINVVIITFNLFVL